MLKTYTADGREKNKGQSYAPQGVACVLAANNPPAVNNPGNGNPVNFSTVEADPFQMATSTSRITAKVPGYYEVEATVGYSGAAACQWRLIKNGAVVLGYHESGGTVWWEGKGSIATVVYLGVGDYIETQQSQGPAVNTAALAYRRMSATLVASSVGVAPEPWHTIGNPGEPAFTQAGAAPYGGAYTAPAFRKLPDGTVRCRGLVNLASGLAATAVLVTLPAGYRPSAQELLATQSNLGAQRVDILAAGSIMNQGASIAAGGWIALGPLQWMAEA